VFTLATQLANFIAAIFPELALWTSAVCLSEVVPANLAWFGCTMMVYVFFVASLF